MNSAVGRSGSKAGCSRRVICSVQNSVLPSAVTRTSQCSGGTNSLFVSGYRPSGMRSTHMTKASPNAARVSGVGQMKSAIAKPPVFTT